MKATDAEVRRALGEKRARTDRGGCPSSEVLAAAATGPGGVSEPVLDHLGQCPDCAFEYRLASSLEPWAAGASATYASRPRPTPSAARFLPLAFAASLVLCVGLVGWVLSLRRQEGRLEARLSEAEQRRHDEVPPSAPATRRDAAAAAAAAEALAQPQANVPLVDLFPADASRGAADIPPAVDAGASPLVVLILNLRQPEAGALYAVDLVGADGSPVWTAERVPAREEALTLSVPSRLLSPGRHRVRLHRVRGDRKTLLETYAFDVRTAGER
jgi:hypothetical protein